MIRPISFILTGTLFFGGHRLSAAELVPVDLASSSTPSVATSPAPPAAPVSAPTPAATATPESFHLHGRHALGLSLSPGLNALPGGPGQTLSYRYWLTDSISAEILGGYGSSVAPNANNIVDQNGNLYYNSTQAYRAGLGFKCNAAQPAHGVFFQPVITGFYTASQSITYFLPPKVAGVQGPAVGRTNNASFGDLYTGLGFEAFIPFWPSLSVEGSVGLVWDMRSDVQNDGSTATNYSLNSEGSGLTPLNGSVHYHF